VRILLFMDVVVVGANLKVWSFFLILCQMFGNDTRKRLENIVKGIVLEGESDSCTAVRNLLCASFRTSTTVKKDFENQLLVKKEQAAFLKDLSTSKNWWVHDLPDERSFLTRGGEAQIYLASDNKNVIKVNDAVYYATWLEFFNSLVIHNLLFEETFYTFLGFIERNNILFAVLRQSFIKSDAPVDLRDVKKLLAFNGFVNTKRNDYYNEELGLILEDMHDENIIVQSNTVFFIDTVFYTVSGG
jgi:Serine/Threonine/Tyrosine Kinase found in polyvalent proteins